MEEVIGDIKSTRERKMCDDVSRVKQKSKNINKKIKRDRNMESESIKEIIECVTTRIFPFLFF